MPILLVLYLTIMHFFSTIINLKKCSLSYKNYPLNGFPSLFSFYFGKLGFRKKVKRQEYPQFIFGDALPDAPELAARGKYKVGVRTLDFHQSPTSRCFKNQRWHSPHFMIRPLKVEVWYPALLKTKEIEVVQYNDCTRPS